MPGEKKLALQGAPDESTLGDECWVTWGHDLKGKRIDSIAFGSPTDSFPLRFRSRTPYHVTLLQGPKRRRGSRATKGEGACGAISIIFSTTTDLCDVITPPCLKGLGCLILIDLTGEDARSVHGGVNTQSRKSQIGWGNNCCVSPPSMYQMAPRMMLSGL